MKNSANLGGCYPPRPSASVDNTLLYLQNSSYPTQPHSIVAVAIAVAAAVAVTSDSDNNNNNNNNTNNNNNNNNNNNIKLNLPDECIRTKLRVAGNLVYFHLII